MTSTIERIAPFKNEVIKNFQRSRRRRGDAGGAGRGTGQFRRALSARDRRRSRIETEKKIRSINPANPDEVVGLTSCGIAKSRRRGDRRGARAPSRRGSGRRRKSAPNYLFKAARAAARAPLPLRRAAGATKSARAGPRPTAIPPKRSTSSSSTRARRCGTRSRSRSCRSPASRTSCVYIPLGVGAVIPPWNFACAIMVGMTSAAIVTGNTVVLKPSSDPPMIAAWFVDLLHEIGLPQGRGELRSGLRQRDRRC